MTDIDKEFDDKQKKEILNVIDQTISLNSRLIVMIQDMGRIANTNRDIPNIGITLNNKIIELSHEFQRHGLSMFSSEREDSKPTVSIIGDALMIHMINKEIDGADMLGNYTSRFAELFERKQGKGQSLEKIGPAKRFVLKIMGWINSFKGSKISYTQEETEELNGYLSEYSKIDQQLWKYNIRDNIIPSVLEYIKQLEGQENEARKMLETYIIPDLQKLGLGDLIPEINQEIEELFKQKASRSWVLPTNQMGEIQAGQTKIGQQYSVGLGKEIPVNDENEYLGEEQV